jgi:hypothetical protein
MKKIQSSKVSNIAMTTGGEKRITKVIDGGIVKEWVGIGWIDLHKANAADRKKYPTVITG